MIDLKKLEKDVKERINSLQIPYENFNLYECSGRLSNKKDVIRLALEKNVDGENFMIGIEFTKKVLNENYDKALDWGMDELLTLSKSVFKEPR